MLQQTLGVQSSFEGEGREDHKLSKRLVGVERDDHSS
jgi:hypothetical protein